MRYFVKQPNGPMAVFSTRSDDFTYVNMTPEETLEAADELANGDASEAAKMIAAGESDIPWTMQADAPSGQRRWVASFVIMAEKHGIETIRERIAEFGLSEADLPAAAIAAAKEHQARAAA